MTKRKKESWKYGDVFVIELKNREYIIGQILDLRTANCVRCALFDEVYKELSKIDIDRVCAVRNLISLVEITREQLDYGVWKIIGNKEIKIPERQFPNEQFKNNNWIGAKTYDAALLEDFVNAYLCLTPWDEYHNPNYLDGFLIDISKKPHNLILIKQGSNIKN